MDENKNQSSGAPSSDTTSALFVSARKKQLEQQEEERRVKEKEEQRLAAEAEVRRLEREVEERRKRAEEETRRIAEEAQAKNAMAAANPQAVLGTPPPASPIWPVKKEPAAPVAAKPAAPGGGAAAGLLKDKKKLTIIIGAAAVVVLAIVLIVALGGGGGGGDTGTGDSVDSYTGGVDIGEVDSNIELYGLYRGNGIAFNYPDGWTILSEEADPMYVRIMSNYVVNGYTDDVRFYDITDEFMYYRDDYGDAVSAALAIADNALFRITDGTHDEYPVYVDETYDGWVSGGIDTEYTLSNGVRFRLYVDFVPLEDRLLMTIFEMPQVGGESDRLILCRRIAESAVADGSYSGGGGDIGGGLTYVTGAALDNGDGTYTYSDTSRNVKATFPTSMVVAGIDYDGIVILDDADGCVVGRNLTERYYEYGGSDAEFTRDYMLQQVYTDFITIYGEIEAWDEPYLYTDPSAQANRLGTAEMVFSLSDRSIYVRAIIYHTTSGGQNTETVMAKVFFVEVGNDVELDYLYNSVVNIVNVN